MSFEKKLIKCKMYIWVWSFENIHYLEVPMVVGSKNEPIYLW